MVNGRGQNISYEYDANGRLTKTTRANGTVETLTYDAAGQITEILDVDKDGNIINKYTFQYDANGNVIKEDKGTSNSVPYIPDDVTMTYDSNNRLITYNGKKIQYDADGNMITVPLNGEMVQCTYDSRNRLITAGNITYVYDAENNRIAIVENGQETNYTVNVLGKLSQVLVRTDANGNDTYYVYGLGLIAQEDRHGNYRTYHYDRRGSTTAITDEEGKITDRIEYGPYGELLNKTGNTDTPFLYNGRYGVMTDRNGLYYMRARYYNPDIKRFVSQDVVLGSIESSVTMNRYAYANGNPISNIDPFGLSADGDDIIHGILDVLGMAPVVGNLFDGINAGYYLLQGDLTNAVLSSISFIPFGDIVGKGTKWGKKFLGIGTKYADDAVELVSKRSTKIAEELGEGVCFVAGTKITTDIGEVCIEDIKVGDSVYSENVETGERGFKKVVRVFVKETSVLVHLDIEGTKIDTTENHPFWVDGKGWVRAADLKPGDMVILKDVRRAKVTSVTIERLAVPVKVYNFEVEDWHTYFVSEIGVLVHNKCWVDNIEGVSKAKPDFYVKPNGDVIPSTGYRYMDSKYAEQTFKTNKALGSYFGFDKFQSSSEARNALQISTDWSDARLRGKFDTLQIIDDIHIPLEYGGKGPNLEPITHAYPEFGTGGYRQVKTSSEIHFDNLKLLGD